jgi:hypothetical protein
MTEDRMMKCRIREIRSGGQTGVDRAALDYAMQAGIEVAGFIPRGRVAEDGRIPESYINLIETSSSNPGERTRRNVETSDGTLIISRGPLFGGSRSTKEIADGLKKPVIHIDIGSLPLGTLIERAREWLDTNNIRVLNIAGPRASDDPEIYGITMHFLKKLLREET